MILRPQNPCFEYAVFEHIHSAVCVECLCYCDFELMTEFHEHGIRNFYSLRDTELIMLVTHSNAVYQYFHMFFYVSHHLQLEKKKCHMHPNKFRVTRDIDQI